MHHYRPMKKNEHGSKRRVSEAAKTRTASSKPALIHPVVIYPFRPTNDYADLEELYRLVAQLDSRKQTYARPITVIDRKTHTAALRDKRYWAGRSSKAKRTMCIG
jgi:hypothetical protein